MRLAILVVIEFMLAMAILILVGQLPNKDEIDTGFAAVSGTVQATNGQIKLVQEQVGLAETIASEDWKQRSDAILVSLEMMENVQIEELGNKHCFESENETNRKEPRYEPRSIFLAFPAITF
ncbi:hypothetical protein Q31b_42620 [Novipirellula aureliae]|uniref:Uncharacterized protein n=1 Tax=Novipirellula aureliae TaxID=2527966 RepID=A0A5C6DMU0_9BACT|nr:hypothetical protein [Novipirellula aureliae]TWU37474.1 hypothetical protein Q31b_42620 [Novipirellula aureliae]